MNLLKAGFSRVPVTPMLGIPVSGYYIPRYAQGVLDELEINAVALSCGTEKAVLLSMDVCSISRQEAAEFAAHISEVTGLPPKTILIHATHTHTGPELTAQPDMFEPAAASLLREYYSLVRHKMADAAQLALADLKPARMGWGTSLAPNIAFVRRFRMKDGSIQTNPGVNNPNIVEPIGCVDERVHVVRLDREGTKSLVLVNFGDHPDTVGGSQISADWPGFLRRTVETALEHTKCIFFNGAQGDVNHVNVHPEGGFLNDLFRDFDNVSRGYGHARYMGRVVAGTVLQVYDKLAYVDVETLHCLQKTVRVPANLPAPAELPEAHRINDLYEAGRDAELPYEGMMRTTVVAEAARMVALEHGPAYFDMELSGIALGNLALLGIPGEPFTGIGTALKEAPDWAAVLPCCLTNGAEGYFPMQSAYDEGGYEARSSRLKAGVAELMIREGLALLAEMREM